MFILFYTSFLNFIISDEQNGEMSDKLEWRMINVMCEFPVNKFRNELRDLYKGSGEF